MREPIAKMTVDEFLVWSETRPGRYELVGATVHEMASERIRHTLIKGAAYRVLGDAVRRAGLPCDVLGDGATVRIDATTAFEPAALLRRGPPLDEDALETPDPLVVVEVLSPSTRNFDAGDKLIGYFAVPSVQHYLMIDPDRDLVVHNRREGDGIGASAHGRGTVIRLDPPGLDVAVDDVLGRG